MLQIYLIESGGDGGVWKRPLPESITQLPISKGHSGGRILSFI